MSSGGARAGSGPSLSAGYMNAFSIMHKEMKEHGNLEKATRVGLVYLNDSRDMLITVLAEHYAGKGWPNEKAKQKAASEVKNYKGVGVRPIQRAYKRYALLVASMEKPALINGVDNSDLCAGIELGDLLLSADGTRFSAAELKKLEFNFE